MASTNSKHSIGLDQAIKMTKKFRATKDKIVRDEHVGKHLIPHCESVDRDAFDSLLQREDCKGVRIYYGMKDENEQVHAIIVGVDARGNDILPQADKFGDTTDPIIVENGSPCPTDCPPTSPLNS